MFKRESLELYLVTDRNVSLSRDIFSTVSKAINGGVTMVQLREKDCDTRTFVEEAIRMKQMLSIRHIPLIINDRIDVALACDADGVHIGQSDMPYGAARSILGGDKIIGLSVENMEQVREANLLDVDYIGISPVYGTPTKTDTAPPFGLEGLREAVRISRHPAVAIGGINISTVEDVIRGGADGAAVVSAIVGAEDPEMAAFRLKTKILYARKCRFEL